MRSVGRSCAGVNRGTDIGTDLLASHQDDRILEKALQLLEKVPGDDAVDDPMVARHGDAHRAPRDEDAVAYDRTLFDRPDGENRRLRRIDDGRELLEIEHPHV